VIKTFVAGAAMAATSVSFLDAAFGQADSGVMALIGGGSLLVERNDGRWVGVVVDPEGQRITQPSGWVVVDGGRLIGLEDGLVVDGTIVSADWIQHSDVIVFVQDGSLDQKAAWPLWARAPVLQSQAPLLERAFEQRTPTSMPELQTPTPSLPTITAPTPRPDVSPQAPQVPRTTR
jgi:hypothetical protein